MKQPKLFLSHIIEAIDKIQNYIHGQTYSAFSKDFKTQDAVIRNLEIIGEASSNLEHDFIKKLPQIPWRALKDFRNKLIHDYWELDLKIIWATAIKRAPELKKLLTPIAKSLKN